MSLPRLTLLLLILFLLNACSTVPMTGRSQFNFMPESILLSNSFAQYNEVVKNSKISTNKVETERLLRVGKRISAAVDEYLKINNIPNNFKWEFTLIEDPQLNAWCMPGGKIAFYTGILPLTQDDLGMAVVMGHEVAHAIANHGGERVSHQMAAQGVLMGLGLYSSTTADPQIGAAIAASSGALVNVGWILPQSRGNELEADEIGLSVMAMAGYDPNGAIPFWQRMAAAAGDSKPPEFLSTHPADDTRVAQIKRLLPNALPWYHTALRKHPEWATEKPAPAYVPTAKPAAPTAKPAAPTAKPAALTAKPAAPTIKRYCSCGGH